MKSFRALLTIAALLVLSATSLSAQAGKVACMDGSKSVAGRGACSSHGGVRTAERVAQARADAKAAKAAKVAAMKKEKAEKRAEKKAAQDEKMVMANKNRRDDDHDARGATAECKDHTYSHAKSRQGACSRHGGVAKFMSGR
jgi:hypothetical protein